MAPPPRRRLRLALGKVAPELYAAQGALDAAVRGSVLPPALYELVKIRASQINGCAYCIDLHTTDAREAGETDQRMHLLAAWRETPLFDERERAALALTEAVTLISVDHVPDEVWAEAAEAFGEDELAALLMGIVAINGWNRIAISIGMQGGYAAKAKH
jgi:AhpD family alkylhydroperoxidase